MLMNVMLKIEDQIDNETIMIVKSRILKEQKNNSYNNEIKINFFD